MLRVASVFLVATFVITSMVREASDKGLELLLALPMPRAVYLAGKLAGFGILTVMDIESYAARAALDRVILQLPESGVGQVIALFQIGAQVTHISVLLDGDTVYEREQPFGGNQLTQDIVRAYGLQFDEADARKKSGDLPEKASGD